METVANFNTLKVPKVDVETFSQVSNCKHRLKNLAKK